MKKKFCLYFLLFFLFCVLGWIYEVVLALIYGWGFVNRGFLFGPYLPVYGFGALLLIFSLRKFMAKKRSLGKVNVTPALVFVLIVLITSAVELATGVALELIFHKRWWDYSADFLNFYGYICPRTSFRFGIGGMVFLYVLTPLFTKVIGKIPDKPKEMIAAILLGLMLADFIHAIVR